MIVFVSDRGSGPQLYIMRVDGSDCRDHAFEHLRAETPLAPRFVHALLFVAITTLHFPCRREDD